MTFCRDQTISTVTDLNHRMWFDRLIMTRNDKAGWDLSIRRGPLTEEISFQEKCPGKSEPLKRDMAAVTTTDDDVSCRHFLLLIYPDAACAGTKRRRVLRRP